MGPSVGERGARECARAAGLMQEPTMRHGAPGAGVARPGAGAALAAAQTRQRRSRLDMFSPSLGKTLL